MNFKDLFWDEGTGTSKNEMEVRKFFYGSTARILTGDESNPITCSTEVDEIIANKDQERWDKQVYSKGDPDNQYVFYENTERDRYLDLGLESFDIYDD